MAVRAECNRRSDEIADGERAAVLALVCDVEAHKDERIVRRACT